MKKIKRILVFLLLLSCSGDDNPTGSFIEISDEGLFALAVKTHAPNDRFSSTVRASKDTVLVVNFSTRQFGWNSSETIWFKAEDSYLHAVYLYYKLPIEDAILIVAVGEGKIVDSFNNGKDLIAPGDRYHHLSRLDSAWFHNNGTTLFYNNFLYSKEEGITVVPGKVKFISETLKTFGNVFLTKEELFELSNRPGWQQE